MMCSNESMLDSIKLFNKANLKNSKVRHKTEDGRIFLEEKTPDGAFVKTQCLAENAGAWVVDTDPDMQVARFRDKIYVSSQDPASELDLLKKHDVTHIINAAGLLNHFPDHFHYKTLTLYDVPGCNIAAVFPECNDFITKALREGGRVLIHCSAGVSRSATIALAYVMQTERIPLQTALQQLKAIRPCVCPNPDFMQQLLQYQNDILG